MVAMSNTLKEVVECAVFSATGLNVLIVRLGAGAS